MLETGDEFSSSHRATSSMAILFAATPSKKGSASSADMFPHTLPLAERNTVADKNAVLLLPSEKYCVVAKPWSRAAALSKTVGKKIVSMY